MKPSDPDLIGKALREDLVHPKTGKVIAKQDERISEKLAEKISKLDLQEVLIVPYVSNDVEYLSADVEDKFVIAQANTPLTENAEFVRPRISSRYHSSFIFSIPNSIDYMDVAPHQIVGISAALIPFLEHDDANRALMGSNMQAQAVP
ncbi:MAG: DNA-directed RNA polymerase subunit beta, partial [Anaerolineales bacterium]